MRTLPGIAWSEWVGQQLNTLVAIIAMSVIGVLALLVRTDDITIPMAALTGIAGLSSTLRAPARGTDVPPVNVGQAIVEDRPGG